jgi:DNA (cytosine-5)-methyltransferase 1
MARKPRVADLFCGAGGFSLGLNRAGLNVIYAADNWAPAVATYRQRFGEHIEHTDLNDHSSLPEVEVIVGGPPCQGFSTAGHRREGDARNSLVGVFARLIARHRPKMFVFENVEGFLTAENGARVLELLDPLIAAGYYIHLRKINAANFGVPQHRKRVIGFGGLGFDPLFPEPTHRALGAPGTHRIGRHLPRTPSLKDALAELLEPAYSPPGMPSDHYQAVLTETDVARIHALEQGQTMKDLPEHLWHSSYRRRALRRVMDGTPTEKRGGAPAGLRRLSADAPSKAITSFARNEFVHPTADRFLTIRECARIQTFPDDYEFSGSASDRALQIGNAIPPLLGEIIGHAVLRGLQETSTHDAGKLASFVPTVAEGVSPALAAVRDLILSRYSEEDTSNAEQMRLWA